MPAHPLPSRPSVTGTIELELPEFDAPPEDPMALMVSWVDAAERLGVLEPYNAALATSDTVGNPTNRMVLAKLFDAEGMTFATNADSVKGHELAVRPRAAATIYWRETRQQLRLVGAVEPIAEEESDEIWADRPLISQAASTASHQSAVLENEAAFLAEAARLAAPGLALPRPQEWRGYLLRPDAIEFWHGGVNRMHRRLRYERAGSGWSALRLYP